MADLMKDSLNLVAVEKMAASLKAVWAQFDVDGFVTASMDGLEQLELKARILHIITALHQHLPRDFIETANILMAAGEKWQKGDENGSFSVFAIWPLIDYVGVYGLDKPEKALDALEVLTPLFSAEFAIRPFINQHFELTYQRLNQWVSHENEHVRRLVSEGIRPRLPWGLQLKQFIKNPTVVVELLELLKDDEAEYVRRSVANNLNDISKNHPELVVSICNKWLKEASKLEYKNRNWIARHATRGLVKQGYPPVFSLLGYSENLDVELRDLSLKKDHIKMGEALEFNFVLTANKPQKFVLDFAIHFMKANGKLAAKTFKLKNIIMKNGETLNIKKQQWFKPITTRKYHAGAHKLEILLNGRTFAEIHFLLEV
ncbi:MAG: DNA alkylation repair protein [Alphaproteobacteria bacterium]|nr:DNA alkylation repair protein [Alphaproteobacteria bacterium]